MIGSSVLVDTSVWIRGFRCLTPFRAQLDRLLAEALVFIHPWTRYELELGGTSDAQRRALERLCSPTCPSDAEVWRFVLRTGLCRAGMGWVDVSILAAAHASDLPLWTMDQPLAQATARACLPALPAALRGPDSPSPQ